MKIGDLIRDTRDGELGIVLDNKETGWVYVFLGNGLCLFKSASFLEVVPSMDGSKIPASFLELVNAYNYVPILR